MCIRDRLVVPEKIQKLKNDIREAKEKDKVKADRMEEDEDEEEEEEVIERLPTPKDEEEGEEEEEEREEISRSPTPSTPRFTEEYVMELKDLQQKIMTLEDNTELQRVVQVIAETGQYEITKKTFDFDLCALDRSTVKRLQDLFFAAS